MLLILPGQTLHMHSSGTNSLVPRSSQVLSKTGTRLPHHTKYGNVYTVSIAVVHGNCYLHILLTEDDIFNWLNVTNYVRKQGPASWMVNAHMEVTTMQHM